MATVDDFDTVIVAAQEALSADTRPCRRSVHRWIKAYDNARKTAKVLKALRILKTFSLQLPDGAQISIDVDALKGEADSGNLADDLTDVLVAAGEAAQERESGLLIAVDEVQYLGHVELAALITAIHRTTQKDLPVILVGAGLPQLPGLAGDAKSYAERLFEFPQIGSLQSADAGAAIRVPERSGMLSSPTGPSTRSSIGRRATRTSFRSGDTTSGTQPLPAQSNEISSKRHLLT